MSGLRIVCAVIILTTLFFSNAHFVQSAPVNLLTNNSLEQLNLLGNNPLSWQRQVSGSITSQLTLERSDTRTGSVSGKLVVSAAQGGNARWQPNWIPANGSNQYTTSFWYKSTVNTELRLLIRTGAGMQQLLQTTFPPSTVWREAVWTYTTPSGTLSQSPALTLNTPGTLIVDDAALFLGASTGSSSSSSSSVSNSSSSSSRSSSVSSSVSSSASSSSSSSSSSVASSSSTSSVSSSSSSSSSSRPMNGWNRAIVSIDFDDNRPGANTYALPLLKKYGFKATQYVITDTVRLQYDDYLTVDQLREWKNAGMTIGSHTLSHPNLTTLPQSEIERQLRDSKTYLDQTFNQNTTDFVTPYCTSNTTVATIAAKYYRFSRDCGYQYIDPSNFQAYHLNAKGTLRSQSFDDFKQAVDRAIANNWWIIFIYHDVSYDTTNEYSISPERFEQQLAYLKSKGVAVRTSGEAYAEVSAQR